MRRGLGSKSGLLPKRRNPKRVRRPCVVTAHSAHRCIRSSSNPRAGATSVRTLASVRKRPCRTLADLGRTRDTGTQPLLGESLRQRLASVAPRGKPQFPPLAALFAHGGYPEMRPDMAGSGRVRAANGGCCTNGFEGRLKLACLLAPAQRADAAMSLKAECNSPELFVSAGPVRGHPYLDVVICSRGARPSAG